MKEGEVTPVRPEATAVSEGQGVVKDGSSLLTVDYDTRMTKGWCAKVTGRDGKYGYRREWQHPISSGTTSGGKSGRKVYRLSEGIYEYECSSYKGPYRVVIRVAGGRVESINCRGCWRSPGRSGEFGPCGTSDAEA